MKLDKQTVIATGVSLLSAALSYGSAYGFSINAWYATPMMLQAVAAGAAAFFSWLTVSMKSL